MMMLVSRSCFHVSVASPSMGDLDVRFGVGSPTSDLRLSFRSLSFGSDVMSLGSSRSGLHGANMIRPVTVDVGCSPARMMLM